MDDRKTSRYFDFHESPDNSSNSNVQAKEPGSNAETSLIEEPIDVLLSTEYRSSVASQQDSQTQDSSSADEWEELKVSSTFLNSTGSQIIVSSNPKKYVTGTDRLAAEQEYEEKVQREISLMWKRLQKVQSSQMLKAYSLCFLAHGIHQSSACDDPLSRSVALSIVPTKIAMASGLQEQGKKRRKRSQALDLINAILDWYRKHFTLVEDDFQANTSFPIDFANKNSHASYIQGLALIFRSLCIRTRLLIHFWPKSLNLERLNESKISSKLNNTEEPTTSRSAERKSTRSSIRKSKQSAYFEEKCDVETDSNVFPFGILFARKSATYIWLEVLDSDDQKWLVVEPFSLSLSTAEQLGSKLTFSLSLPNSTKKIPVIVAYVVAFDENGQAADVTARYASSTLHTSTRKERGDSEQAVWWRATLSLLRPSGKLFEDEEMELRESASAKKHPVPSTIAALTSHPLYVLGRHVHKYEAIYPPDTQPIAHVRGEPVFDRSYVHGLHTREKWLLEGQQVRANEQPYKTVTGHRKPLKKDDRERQPAKMVGLFGQWQTEEYVPPPIVDGKLPRNVYGNIEMFKPWMLPQGCCHMTQQGIQSTAKRLDINFVPAMVGWDFHAGVNHPVIDGIIVFEDVRDVLECAWRQEKHIAVEEDLTRKSEHAVSNWKRLVKAILLKERLKDRYLS